MRNKSKQTKRVGKWAFYVVPAFLLKEKAPRKYDLFWQSSNIVVLLFYYALRYYM